MINKQCFLVSRKEHDLTTLLKKNTTWNIIPTSEISCVRATAKSGDILVLPADDYPEKPVVLDEETWDWLTHSGVRAYIEYPDSIPGLGKANIRQASRLERGWVCGLDVLPNALVNIGTSFLAVFPKEGGWLRIGKLAGYDRLAFPVEGTPTEPLLFEAPQGNVLIAATSLANFRASRLAPQESWRVIWEKICRWLAEDDDICISAFHPLCEPVFSLQDSLPAKAQLKAVQSSLQWFHDARMLLGSEHETLYRRIAGDDFFGSDSWTGGDGSAGVLEGYISQINYDGRQPTRCWRRADCVAETAGAFALGSRLAFKEHNQLVARNLADWLYGKTLMSQGDRANKSHPAYGLIGWHDRAKYGSFNHADGWDIFYGDDNARVVLGSIACAGALGEDRWLVPIIRCILANLRTSGFHGLRKNAIWKSELTGKGWEYYFSNEELDDEWISPHYQCYLSACYLWLYQQTGDEMLLQHGKEGIRILMEAYPQQWRWTNGLQQERARMLLPLAWLFRITKDPIHQGWLEQMTGDLLAHQVSCGAIREVLAEGNGKYGPPHRHEDYGTREASLLQRDGDPVADLLYTCNFAFLGLHEAAAATGEALYTNASDQLAEFLLRIQTRSERKELSGLWYRAFDFKRWEVWASDADGAWGAWCVETGWTQAWITMVLSMRELNTSLWEIYQPSNARKIYEQEKEHFLKTCRQTILINA